ncbi:MAG: hypothetical protein JST50_22090 [Bacteroidetes bacterium]|jgi:hypothetical protein|nr:hypothetical protein [Bacteroidota bacterium]
MKFSEIYESVIFLWGDEIDISDLTITEELSDLSNRDKHQVYSAFSKNLSAKWNEVELVIGPDNPYLDLMVWTMYQAFWNESKNLFLQGQSKLLTKNIDQKAIEGRYFKNLQNNGWEQELASYVNDVV